VALADRFDEIRHEYDLIEEDAMARLRDETNAGAFDRDWRSGASYACLTGNAQMALDWIRLAQEGLGNGLRDNARRAIDDASLNQRPDRQVGRGRIASRIRDQARAWNALAAEFRQPVNRFGQQRRLRVRLFIPLPVVFDRAQPECPAQVDDPRSCIQHPGRQFHRNIRRRGEKHDLNFLRAHGIGGGSHLPRAFRMAQPALVRRVVPMLHQDLRLPDVRLWGYFCQVSDSTTSYGSYSGAIPNEKITWGKLGIDTPKFVIESDATIVVPLMWAQVLGW